MENFASYILNEKDYIQKMIITLYMSERTGIFFDKSIVLRAQIAKMFVEYAKIDVDINFLLTAVLLCNCKKVDNAQKMGKLETYAKEGADYLESLGFNSRFCKICQQLNRYSPCEPRDPEGDILELIDQFTGLILRREEREAFLPQEALVILTERNLKNTNNRYLNEFALFVNDMETVLIKDNIEVPVFRKLVKVYNDEPSVKSFIATLGNNYSDEIDRLIGIKEKKDAKEVLYDKLAENKSEDGLKNAQSSLKNDNIVQPLHRYVRVIPQLQKKAIDVDGQLKEFANRAMFSKEIAERVLSGNSLYKIEEDE